MSLFESLYGRCCNTPISWSDPVNRVLIGPYMLVEMEKEMQVIKKNLKLTKDRQKSYADEYRVFKEFQVGEQVYLCINPKKSSLRIGSCAKLAPWWNQKEDSNWTLVHFAVKILMIRSRAINQAKVKWKHFGFDEATWKVASQMQAMSHSLLVG
eukprot:PITA_34815